MMTSGAAAAFASSLFQPFDGGEDRDGWWARPEAGISGEGREHIRPARCGGALAAGQMRGESSSPCSPSCSRQKRALVVVVRPGPRPDFDIGERGGKAQKIRLLREDKRMVRGPLHEAAAASGWTRPARAFQQRPTCRRPFAAPIRADAARPRKPTSSGLPGQQRAGARQKVSLMCFPKLDQREGQRRMFLCSILVCSRIDFRGRAGQLDAGGWVCALRGRGQEPPSGSVRGRVGGFGDPPGTFAGGSVDRSMRLRTRKGSIPIDCFREPGLGPVSGSITSGAGFHAGRASAKGISEVIDDRYRPCPAAFGDPVVGRHFHPGETGRRKRAVGSGGILRHPG